MDNENEKNNTEKKSGGLYAGINISPRAADSLAALSAAALALCLGAAIFSAKKYKDTKKRFGYPNRLVF